MRSDGADGHRASPRSKRRREAGVTLMRSELHERPVVNSWDKLIALHAQSPRQQVRGLPHPVLAARNVLSATNASRGGPGVELPPVLHPRSSRQTRAFELQARLRLGKKIPSADPTLEGRHRVTKDIVKGRRPLGLTYQTQPDIGAADATAACETRG